MTDNELNERFDRIYGPLSLYISTACRGFARRFTLLQADDLRQECAIKLLSILRKHPDMADDNITNLFKVSIYNMLRDIYRVYAREMEQLDGGKDSESAEFAVESSVIEDLIYEDYVQRVRVSLSADLDRRLFDLLLTPDEHVVTMAQERQAEKETSKRTSNTLVMNADVVVITEAMLASRLGVSPATLSRAMKRLRQQLVVVLDQLPQ